MWHSRISCATAIRLGVNGGKTVIGAFGDWDRVRDPIRSFTFAQLRRPSDCCHKCQPLRGSFLWLQPCCICWKVTKNKIYEKRKDLQLHRSAVSPLPFRCAKSNICNLRLRGPCRNKRQSQLHFAAAGISSWMCMINLCAMHYISLLNKPGNLGDSPASPHHLLA